MKNLLIILFLFISIVASAQRIKVSNGEIEIKALKTESVNDAFEMINKLMSFNIKWYDRYVVKNGKTYYRSFLNKRKTYLVSDKDLIKIETL